MSLSPCTHAAFHVLDDCVRVAKRSLLATNAVHHVRPSTFSFSFARRDEELRESTVTITSVLGLVAPDNLTHNLPLYLAVPASNTHYIVHSHTCECFSRENRGEQCSGAGSRRCKRIGAPIHQPCLFSNTCVPTRSSIQYAYHRCRLLLGGVRLLSLGRVADTPVQLRPLDLADRTKPICTVWNGMECALLMWYILIGIFLFSSFLS